MRIGPFSRGDPTTKYNGGHTNQQLLRTITHVMVAADNILTMGDNLSLFAFERWGIFFYKEKINNQPKHTDLYIKKILTQFVQQITILNSTPLKKEGE